MPGSSDRNVFYSPESKELVGLKKNNGLPGKFISDL